jgi:hypothetical protein
MYCSNRLWFPHSLLWNKRLEHFSGIKGEVVKLTTRLHTVSRSRMQIYLHPPKRLRGKSKVRKSYHFNSPRRPVGLWDVETLTFARQLAHRWGWSRWALPTGRFLYVFLLEAASTHVHSATGRIRSIEKSSDLIGNLTRYLPCCNIVLQPTTLQRGSCFSWRGA